MAARSSLLLRTAFGAGTTGLFPRVEGAGDADAPPRRTEATREIEGPAAGVTLDAPLGAAGFVEGAGVICATGAGVEDSDAGAAGAGVEVAEASVIGWSAVVAGVEERVAPEEPPRPLPLPRPLPVGALGGILTIS